MRMQLILNEVTVNAIIKALKETLESPFFMFNDKKYVAGKVTKHHLINSSPLIRGEKRRPMILFSFNGSWGQCFYEGDEFISENGKITIISEEKRYVYTKATATGSEARRVMDRADLNKSISDAYWRSVEADMEDLFGDVFGDDSDIYASAGDYDYFY